MVDPTHCFDTHAHLTADRFDEDRDDLLARARDAGVGQIVTIGPGWGVDGNAAALELAAEHDWIRAAVGVHPQNATAWNDDVAARLAEWSHHPQAVAIGETGLDYARDYAEFRDQQLVAFAAQCELAVERQLPLIVHTRDALEDTLAVLREHRIGEVVPGVIHFFTLGLAEARAFLDLGLMLSIPGVVTLPNAPDLVSAVPDLPLDRLMIETDSPFAAPVPKRGRRNEPAYVVHVAAKVAELMELDEAEVIAATTRNAQRFFDWEHTP